MTWHFESDTQRYFENGQFDHAESDSLKIDVEFVHDERVRVTIENFASALEADFASESHGMRAYVSDDMKQVVQLVTETGSFGSEDDIYACVLMSPVTNNFIMFVCESRSQHAGSTSKSETMLGDKTRFLSNDHIRYQSGTDVSGHNHGCKRGIEIKRAGGEDVFIATIHNLDGNHPFWGDNVQMAPKRMRVVRESEDKVQLRGFGKDRMGGSFSDYGLTIHFETEEIDKVTLHLHDRDVSIEYLK